MSEHRITSIRRRRRLVPRLSARLSVLLVPVALLVAVGCSNDNNNSKPTPVPTSADACTKLAGCNQCFLDGSGQCLSTDACAGRVSADVAACVATVNGCDQQALGACLRTDCGGTGGECQTG